jgi:hypothetical protein
MELMEKRKSVRLNLNDSWVETSTQVIKVNNLSLEGLNLQGLFPVNESLSGFLFLNKKLIGPVSINIVNHQNDSSGGVFTNSSSILDLIKPWFNPIELVNKLRPNSFNNHLTYNDRENRCSFDFTFDDYKKIQKVKISLFENTIIWDNLSNQWQTFSSHQKDGQVDKHKLSLAQNMVGQTKAFPQSFKDWLLDLF